MSVSRFRWVASLMGVVALGCGETAGPVDAPQFIVHGIPTAGAFGNVGALMFDFRGDGISGADQLCTGSLISETVFLTAAHCVQFLQAGSQLYVSFSENLYPAPAMLIPALSYHFDPLYGHDSANPHDIAVVMLPAGSTTGITPLALPTAGYLDQLAAKGGLSKALFFNVGYGDDATSTGRPGFFYDGVRKFSKSRFKSLQPNWLGLLMQTSATGEGGDCYGDSGGPKFLESDTNTVLAIVVTGDAICRATSTDYRVDTPSARYFLGQYVTLP